MKARDIVGRRVVRIRQERFHNENTGKHEWDLKSITFDDGRVLLLLAHESDNEPWVDGVVIHTTNARTGRSSAKKEK